MGTERTIETRIDRQTEATPEMKAAAAAEAKRAETLEQVEEYNDLDAHKQLMVDQALLLHNVELFHKIGAKKTFFKKTLNLEGEPAGILNKLMVTKGSSAFIQMKPHEISELVPMIKIYKVLYEEGGEREIEFKFPTRADYSPHNGGENMLNDTTDSGVGIKSFEYKYIGSNPATVRNDIEAKLVLYFQNFSEMLRPRYASDGTKYAYIDLFDRARKVKDDLIPPTVNEMVNAVMPGWDAGISRQDTIPAPGPIDFEALDVTEDCGALKTTEPRRAYHGVDFEMKTVVGWAWSDSPNSVILDSHKKTAIKNAKQSFFLTLIDHDFTFEDDGTFILELNYRARLSGILVSPKSDILNLENIHGLYESGYTTHDFWQNVGNFFLPGDPLGTEITTIRGSPAEVFKAFNTKIKELEGCCDAEEDLKKIKLAMKDFLAKLRALRFRALLGAMIDSERVYTFSVPNDVIGAFVRGDKEGSLIAGTTVVEGVAPAHSQGRKLFVNDLIATFEGDTDDWKKEMSQPKTIKTTGYPMAYFFLGDLIDLTATMTLSPESVATWGGAISPEAMNKLKILLGTIELEPAGGGDPFTIALADLPISLANFRRFWFKKVIEAQKEKYNLLHFIRDLVRDLIINSINSVYYSLDSKVQHQKLKFKSATISLPKVQPTTGDDPAQAIVGVHDPGTSYDDFPEDDPANYGPVNETQFVEITTEDPLEAWMLNHNTYGKRTVDMDDITAQNPLVYLNSSLSIEEMHHYVIIYVENGSMNYLKKGRLEAGGEFRRKRDENIGIQHFGFGEDKGILRTAKFNKTSQPFLREARYIEDGYNPFQQLSNVYDVDLQLFGAPFFYPGQYFWLSPFGLSKSTNVAYRLGSPDSGTINNVGASWSNLMGLGGYHIIIEVHGILEDGKYHTNIKARYDNSGADYGERSGHGQQDDTGDGCPESE